MLIIDTVTPSRDANILIGRTTASAALIPTPKNGRPVGKKKFEPQKRRGTEIPNMLIIDTVTPSREILSEYKYVRELITECSADALETLLMWEK